MGLFYGSIYDKGPINKHSTARTIDGQIAWKNVFQKRKVLIKISKGLIWEKFIESIYCLQ